MYNIDPTLWGKYGWTFLHYITLAYPENPDENTKNMYRDLFKDIIWKYLPCEKCRFNYKKHLNELPLTEEILNSRNKLIYWLVDIHNIVNDETGKRKISYKEFNDIYIKMEKKQDMNNSLYIVICLLIILIILFMIYKKIQN
jgi:hypothetical protein